MNGLVPGRIVYFVFNEQQAGEVMRRRTTGKSIADRMKVQIEAAHAPVDTTPEIYGWPAGAQAHIGNEVKAGDICPAMVLRVWSQESGCSNLKVMLDGSDEYWATSVNFAAGTPGPLGASDVGVYPPGTWHWMFDGQAARYAPPVGAVDPSVPHPGTPPTRALSGI